MLNDLKGKLQGPIRFPSPPAVALQIIALASDPDNDIAKVAAAVGKDPGLAATILRAANSPVYSKRRRCATLRQALVVLGLNAATSLALSFSLIATYRNGQGAGVDYPRYWRRAILGAAAARRLGCRQITVDPENIFLAGLLQDLAILAIDRVDRDFYRALPAHASHAEIVAHERLLLAADHADHADLGAWLLRSWKLPESLCRTIEFSHDPLMTEADTAVGIAARCVALGSECVEVLLAPEAPADLGLLSEHARQWLGIDSAALMELMASMVAEVPAIEGLFDTWLLDPEIAAAMLETARELLLIRRPQEYAAVPAAQGAPALRDAGSSMRE